MISLFVFTGPSFISWFHGESLEVEATCEGFSKGCKNFPQPKARMRTSWGKHSRGKKRAEKKRVNWIRSTLLLQFQWLTSLMTWALSKARFLVTTSVSALHHDKTGSLTSLSTSIKELQAGDIPLPLLIKASWCHNQSPIAQPATFTRLRIVPRPNKQDSHSRFEDKCGLKGQAVFKQSRTKPDADIHPHVFHIKSKYLPGCFKCIWSKPLTLLFFWRLILTEVMLSNGLKRNMKDSKVTKIWPVNYTPSQLQKLTNAAVFTTYLQLHLRLFNSTVNDFDARSITQVRKT